MPDLLLELKQARYHLCAFALELEESGALIAPEAVAAREALIKSKDSDILSGIIELATQLETFVGIDDSRQAQEDVPVPSTGGPLTLGGLGVTGDPLKILPERLWVVDRDYEHEEFQRFMHSDLVKSVIASKQFPSVFSDFRYPDLMVVWDAGEGPHNPEVFAPELVDEGRWLERQVYPPKLWRWVVKIAEECFGERGARETYCVFWLRGCDAADMDYRDDGSPPYDAATATGMYDYD